MRGAGVVEAEVVEGVPAVAVVGQPLPEGEERQRERIRGRLKLALAW